MRDIKKPPDFQKDQKKNTTFIGEGLFVMIRNLNRFDDIPKLSTLHRQ